MNKQLQKPLTLNLGRGEGHTVLEVIRAFQKTSRREIRYKIGARRPGDVAASWANADLAKKQLNWHASRSLEDMCRDIWRWQNSSSA